MNNLIKGILIVLGVIATPVATIIVLTILGIIIMYIAQFIMNL